MADKESGSNKAWMLRILKMGVALVGATVVGTWATRRTSWSPIVRGGMRAGGAVLAAYLLRKKAPNAAVGLGTYAIATLAGGAVEQYDMSRYLSATDSQRAALGSGSTAGAQPAGTPGALPAGAGPATGLEGLAAYRSEGYAVL